MGLPKGDLIPSVFRWLSFPAGLLYLPGSRLNSLMHEADDEVVQELPVLSLKRVKAIYNQPATQALFLFSERTRGDSLMNHSESFIFIPCRSLCKSINQRSVTFSSNFSIQSQAQLQGLIQSWREWGRMGHMGKYVSLIENSLTSSSYKQPQQQQNKTSDKPHEWRDRFVASWRTAEPTTRLRDALCSEAQRRGGCRVGGGHEAWQSCAVAPFTVAVNS